MNVPNPRHKWPRLKLKYAARLIGARAESRPEGSPYVGLENIQSRTGTLLGTQGLIDEELADGTSTVNLFEAGDVLFGKLRPYLAKAWVATFSGACTTEALVLRPNACVLSGYLCRVVLSPDFIREVDTTTFGSKMPRADWADIGNIEIPVPPLDVQQEIEHLLSAQATQIGALIDAKQRLLDMLTEKRRALIANAVTRGLNPNVPMRDSGIEWLVQIPVHWDVVHLKRVLTEMTYGTSQSVNQEGSVGILRMGDIRDGVANLDNLAFLDDVDSNLDLTVGDLLFNRTNSLDQIGKVALIRALPRLRISFASYLVRLRCSSKMNAEYLNFLLNSSYANAFARSEALPSIGQTNLNPDRFSYLPIPLPPKAEQEQISENLTIEAGRLTALQISIRKSLDLLIERRASLLADFVTGGGPKP